MAVWTSVEYIEISVNASTEGSWQNLNKSQDPAQCTPWYSAIAGDTDQLDENKERLCEVQFRDNAGQAQVRCVASLMTESTALTYKVFVVEWDSSITVQQVAVTTLNVGVSTDDIAVTDVGDQTTAFLMYSFSVSATAADPDNHGDILVYTEWNAAATDSVTIIRRSVATNGAINGTLYVVECDAGEFTVDHVALAPLSTDESFSQLITATVLADTFLIPGCTVGTLNDDMHESVWQTDLEDTTHVRIRRAVAGVATSATSHRVQVVECQNNEWDVQRNDALTLATTSVTDSITGIDQARSVVKMNHCTGFTAIGRNDSADGADVGDLMCAIDFSTDSLVRVQKLVATITNDIVSYEVIQFASSGVDTAILVPMGPIR